MSLSASFSQTNFIKTNFLIKTNKTFLLLTFDSVETNRFTKIRKVLSNYNAKLHFAKTNHINFAFRGLFPQASSTFKGQCLLITIPAFEFEVLKRLSSFATANGLTVLTCVRDGLFQSNMNLNVFAKFTTSASVKIALLKCLHFPLTTVVNTLRTPFTKLLASFPPQVLLNQC
ncbi:MAG: 50S ribosomal protein L10 [Candidatus Hodgkinia cicadicola]